MAVENIEGERPMPATLEDLELPSDEEARQSEQRIVSEVERLSRERRQQGKLLRSDSEMGQIVVGDFSQLPPNPAEWTIEPAAKSEPIQSTRELRERIPMAGVEAYFYRIKS